MSVHEHDTSWGLALSLDGQSSDFVLGVEIGRLWEQMKDPEAFSQSIHPENLEIVMRVMESTGRKMHVEDSSTDEWVNLIMEAA